MLNHMMLEAVLDGLSDGLYITDRNRVIRYWNRGAERLSGFTREEAVGRACRDKLLTHVDHEGRCLCGRDCPLLATLRDGQVREADVFMHHKCGHRVPVHVAATPLRDETGQIIAVAEAFHDTTAIQQAREAISVLEKLAMVDPLTGLPNRRCIELRLRQRMDEHVRYGWPIAVLLADIDHFKRFNDTHGHDVGDRALKMVATALASSVRSTDVVGRWGGEEFLAIITAGDPHSVHAAAERARMLVETSYFTTGGQTLAATISIGVAEARPADSAASIVQRADACLYESKRLGRNLVTIARIPA